MPEQGWSKHDEPSAALQHGKKRRRRILSCRTCRRLKCRCEFEDGAQACSRCRNLRLVCEPSDGDNEVGSAEDTADGATTRNSHERLEFLERRVAEMESTLETLKEQQRHQVGLSTEEQRQSHSADSANEIRALESDNDIQSIDCFSSVAPISVVRQAELHAHRRRLLDFSQSDLVANGLLDEQASNDLIKGFLSQSRHLTNIVQVDHRLDDGTFRQSSPFLHAVLCLQGIKSNELGHAYSALHRQVYERVRSMQGQVMLASPLRIDESIATLIMALFCSSPTHGPEYIDSWLMSGHCAQQFILSTEFSEMITRIDAERSSLDDLRTLRVWGNISLCHLQWAAATGRPPIIPKRYIMQNSALQKFLSAAVTDMLLYAEIVLYSELCDRLSSGESELTSVKNDDFQVWKEDWKIIRGLPAAYFIDLGYEIACMTLTQRVLQVFRGTKTDAPAAPVASQHEGTLPGSIPGNGFDSATSETTATHDSETRATSSALKVLQSYLRTASASSERLPEFYVISVEFAIMLIARAHASPFQGTEKAQAVKTLSRMLETCTTGRLSQVRHGISRALAVVRGEVASAPKPPEQRSQSIQPVVMQEDTRDCNSSPTTLAEQLDWSACIMPEILQNPIEMQAFFSGGYFEISTAWPSPEGREQA